MKAIVIAASILFISFNASAKDESKTSSAPPVASQNNNESSKNNGPQCKKGKPCGKSCISKEKTCKK